ncbi:L-lactate permease [uncultured Megasphaera sp.]|uniref:L-lactate permease n=1 Tax=uncultured Megasphaera sp. TaxID=165188 RepID=UPI00265B06D6|nr:L-lactate permease [uncultured Megasphaera sp.]
MMVFLAVLPLLWLIIGLSVLKVPAWKACLVAAVISFIVAVVPFAKEPGIMLSGALEGVALAVWPILLVITAAIFTYNLVVKTGAMETIKTILTSVSPDMRVLSLLLAWGFGAFMEGMAGFGTAVAIPAAMMVGLGFHPLKSILACLVANSVPTTFGSIAIPTTTLATLTGLDSVALGQFIAIQLFILNTVSPFFVVMIMGGGPKALKGVFLITLISGLALSIPELLINMAMGPELSVIVPSVIIMGAIAVCAKVLPTNDPEYKVDADVRSVSGNEAITAMMPFILIFVLLILTSKLVPAINGPLSSIKTSVPLYMGPGAKPYTFVWIATPGIMIFLSALIGGAIQKASFGKMMGVLGDTFKGLKFTYITIISVVVTAKLMTYSAMTATIAGALVDATGSFYPAFAPIVGALGAFITGSGTNANVLFGPLQTAAAGQMSPGDTPLALWLAATNSGGAGIGKMFSPQSIAIGIGAVAPALEAYLKEAKVEEGKANELRQSILPNVIMQNIAKYFVIYIIVAGIVCYFGQSIFLP